MKLRSKLIWVCAAVGFVALMAWALRPQPVSVETATVVKGKFEQTVDEDGKTRVRERYIVTAPLGGRLERIELKAGDPVRMDDVVTTITPNPPSLQDARTIRELQERAAAANAGVMRATAMEARARVALAQARVDEARAAKLAEQGFVSAANREQSVLATRMRNKELEAARYESIAAERELAQARAALAHVREEAGANVGRANAFKVRAPVSGRILRILQESAGPVAPGAGLLEIADVNRLEVVVDVLSTEAVGIPPNADVHIEAGSGHPPMQGRVRRIEPSAFTKVSALGVEEQRVNIIVDLVDGEAGNALGDGYRVDARIVVYRAEDAVLVPTGALFRDGAGYAVFVVDDGMARKRSIDVPRRNARQGLVSKGLNVDERVIVFPGDAVADGVRVEVRNSARE